MNFKSTFLKIFLGISVLLSNSLLAQNGPGTPTYFSVVPNTTGNSFPLNAASTGSNKVQWIYKPGVFSTAGGGSGVLVGSGNNITKVYFRLVGVNTTNALSNFTISLGQNVGTDTVFSSNTFITGLTAVYAPAGNISLTGATANSWYYFTLSTPFAYNPNLSLVVELKVNQSAAGGTTISSITHGGVKRIYGNYANPTGTLVSSGFTPVGIDVVAGGACTSPPTAGTVLFTPSTGVCPASTISLNLTGNSVGSGQTYRWDTSSTLGGTYTQIDTARSSPFLNFSPQKDLYYRCAVTCSGNTQFTTPVQLALSAGLATGTYTINSGAATGGTNFNSFTDFANAIRCGVTGPITVNVTPGSGPYVEQVSFPHLNNTSATNTVTINGNGCTLTSSGSAVGNYATLALEGADYMRFNNLIVNNTGASTAFGIHLSNNSNNNIFTNVTVNVSTTATATTCMGIVMSGSKTVYSTAGANGTNNLFNNCAISGGYAGIAFYGDGSNYLNNANNSVRNCTIQDFYVYGIYNYYQGNNSIYKNIFERPNRTNTSTTYGIMLTTGCVNVLAERNFVRNLFGAISGSTSACYPLYCSSTTSGVGTENKFINNIVSNISSNGTQYGVYLSGATDVQVYNNTVVLDDATSTAGATYGIYNTSTGTGIDIRNNLIHIGRGGTGTKYCVYLSSSTAVCDDNNLYMTSTGGTTNAIGFFGSAFTSLASWQTANGGVWDQGSLSTNPIFTNPLALNYKPTSPIMNNKGVSIAAVTRDFDSVARPVIPDIGAYEYNAVGTNGSLVWNSPAAGPQTVGLKTIKVDLQNTLSTTITSANITYTDGATSTTQNFTGLSIIASGSATLTFTTQYNLTSSKNLYAYINSINGATDFTQTDDTTALINLCLPLTGSTYTINSALPTSGTNFQTFADAIDALSCGISSAKTINVVAGSGPYNEQIDIPAIPGASAVNTITINGNGNLLTSAGTAGYVTLNLNGADYFRVNNLRVENTHATNAIAVHLMNDATNNIFTNCHFMVSTTNTASTNAALSMSGSVTSNTASGTNGSNNTFNTDTMTGGYYAAVIYGNSTNNALNSGNTLNNCLIRDYYIYGVYSIYQTGLTVRNCIVERPNRVTVSTGYGIVLTTGNINGLVEKNMIRTLYGASGGSSTTYCLYNSSTAASVGNENKFYNNIVTNIKTTGTLYGIYLTSGTNAIFYHNTINIDDPTGNGAVTGIYSTTTNVAPNLIFKNNIIYINKNGTGAKYCMDITSAGIVSNYNDLYIDTTISTNVLGQFNAVDFKSFNAWKTANAGAFDQNSLYEIPAFANNANHIIKPTSASLDNKGTNVGITTDYVGTTRSATTPDIGAYEFNTNGANGAVAWVSPTGPQTTGNKTITFKMTNTSLTFAIDSFNVTYTDGTTSVTQNFTGVGLAANTNQNFNFTTPYNLTASSNIRVYINSINGTQDINQADDTTNWTYVCVALSGTTYTVNSTQPTAGTNFNSFADAIAAFSCGITSPKILNVVAGTGPYNEQVDLGAIPGASAVNTVTINGNGNTLTSAGSGSNYATLNLNSTRYLIVNNLNIENTGATNGFGVHLMGDAEFNTFNNCAINVSTNATGSTCMGITSSGSKTSYSTSGNNASNNTFNGCTITGGYMAVVFYGNSADYTQNGGNVLNGCTIRDYYLYGNYNIYQTSNIIRGCTIERPTRTNTSTTYGVFMTTGCSGFTVEKNRIRNLFGAIPGSTQSCYGIYMTSASNTISNQTKIYNNVITKINSNGLIYGIYLLTSTTYVQVYHNTINLDDATSTTTSNTYGIYTSNTTPTGIDIKNNMITISRGGAGTKYCIYLTGAVASSNYNNLYITSTSGTNAVGFFGTAFTTLANWKTANSNAWDQNSISVDPLYTNPATYNLLPTSYFSDNKGTNVSVTQDVNNNTRSLTLPDIGAYEYNYILPATAIPFRINSTASDSFSTAITTPSGVASCVGGNADDEKFFSFVKPAGKTTMNVVLYGSSNFNGVFEVFGGTNPTNFAVLGCVNNSSNTNNQSESYYFTNLPAGDTTFYIRVYDYRAGAGSGAFRISVYHLTNATPNNVPCLFTNASNNTAKVAGNPYILSAYDNGYGGGLAVDTTQTPPIGPNFVYWIGSTAFAPYIAGAPISSCGTSHANPKRTWYGFNVPALGDVDVILRTNYGNTSKPVIMEAMTATVIPCPTLFNVIKCSNNGILKLTAADMAPFIGQKIYVQLTEDGGTNTGVDYMLSVQGVAPAISASNITTNTCTINLPTAPANLSRIKVYYRKASSTSGYINLEYPSTATSINLSNLTSGVAYHVWVAYFNNVNAQVFFSDRITVTTLPGCAGTLPAPTAAIAPLPNTSCTKALITWPSFALANSTYKYRLYYRDSNSTGFSIKALNDTFITLSSLGLNNVYQFFYKAVCSTGTALSSVSTYYPNCGTPKTSTPIVNNNGTVTIDGITYSLSEFTDIAMAAENKVPVDGEWHYIELGSKESSNLFELSVYPNPANETTTVEFEVTPKSETSLSIVSTDGRIVHAKNIDSNNGILNPVTNKIMKQEKIMLNEMAGGIYLIKVTEDGITQTKQLIIEK